jgi:acid phosphatase (class A)
VRSAKRKQALVGGALFIAAAVTLLAEWTHARDAAPQHHSYLGSAVGQLGDQLPPPPREPAVVEADRRAFKATRALQGSARWTQAVHDTDQSDPALLSDFSCASGLELTRERAPHLASLLANAGADSAHVASRAKARFRRARPYVLDQGPTCAATQGLGDFHDYPSGHSSRGWAWALVLAELLPDRRQQLSERAKAYADSRVVCGVHSPTGASAGRAVAVLTVDSLMRNPRFRADMQQARHELAALKQRGQVPSAHQCRSDRSSANLLVE